MARSAVILEMEMAIKPLLVLVKGMMAVKFRMTTMVWLCRTFGSAVVVNAIDGRFECHDWPKSCSSCSWAAKH